jgi:hypothetical protein
MQVARGVGYGENWLQVEVQRCMSERSDVYQCRLSMRRLQSKRKVYGYGGGTASPLGIEHGKNFAAGTFLPHTPLGRAKAHKGFQQVSRGCRALDKFPRPGPHCANDYLRLIEIADGKYCGVRHLLVQQFNRSQGRGRIVRRDVD